MADDGEENAKKNGEKRKVMADPTAFFDPDAFRQMMAGAFMSKMLSDDKGNNETPAKNGFDFDDIMKYFMMMKLIDTMSEKPKEEKPRSPLSEAMEQAMTARIMKDILNGDDTSIKKYEELLEKRDSETAKMFREWIDSQKKEKEDKEKEEKIMKPISQKMDSLSTTIQQLKLQLNALQNNQSGDWLSEVNRFNELRENVKAAYEMLNPKEKAVINPESKPIDTWTPDDFAEAAKKIVESVQGVANIFQGVKGVKPPKKKLEEGGIPPAIKKVIDAGYEKDGVWYSPNGYPIQYGDSLMSKVEVEKWAEAEPEQAGRLLNDILAKAPPSENEQEEAESQNEEQEETQESGQNQEQEAQPENEQPESGGQEDSKTESEEEPAADNDRIGEDINGQEINDEGN